MQYFTAKNGDDNNPGTEEKPFKTVQRGVDALSEQDTLYIKEGVYHEKVAINTEKVFVSSFENDVVVIDGRVGMDGDINSGLPTGRLNKVAPDGKGGCENGLFDITASHVGVYGPIIKRSRGKGIRVFSRTNKPVTDVTILNTTVDETRRHAVLVDANNVSLLNSVVRGSGSYYTENRAAAKSTDWSAAIAVKGTGFLMQFCLVERCFGEAIAATPNRPDFKGEVSYCVFRNNFRAALFQVFSQAYVHHNLFVSTPDSSMPGGAVGVNIAQGEDPGWGATRNMKFQHNIIAGFDSALRISGQPWRDLIENVRIENNTIFECNKAFTPQAGGAKDMHMAYNLVYKCGKQIDDLYDGKRFEQAWTNGPNFWERPVSHPYDHIHDQHGDPGFKNKNVNLNFPNGWDVSAFEVDDKFKNFGANFENAVVGPNGEAPVEPPIEPPIDPNELVPTVMLPIHNPEKLNHFTVKWEPVEGAAEYRVQTKKLNTRGWGRIYIGEETQIQLDNVEDGVYYFKVRYTFDKSEYSNWSNVENTEVSSDYNPPEDPDVVTGEVSVKNVTWKYTASVDKFYIHREENS